MTERLLDWQLEALLEHVRNLRDANIKLSLYQDVLKALIELKERRETEKS